MCQGFSVFSGFLHHFVLAKVATSSIRVNPLISQAVLGDLGMSGFRVVLGIKG